MIMAEFLSYIDSHNIVQLVALVLTAISGTAIAIVAIWLGYRKSELTIQLKQDMLTRGMSAEEIKMVLEAGSTQPAIKIAPFNSRAAG
jgi:hypothetical protein